MTTTDVSRFHSVLQIYTARESPSVSVQSEIDEFAQALRKRSFITREEAETLVDLIPFSDEAALIACTAIDQEYSYEEKSKTGFYLGSTMKRIAYQVEMENNK